MQSKGVLWMAAVAMVALAVACGSDGSKTPTSPTSAATVGDSAAAADGSTLKATAPAPVSPTGGGEITVPLPTLQWTASTGKFVPATFTYRAQLLNAAGALVKETTTSGLTWTLTDALDVGVNYQWKVRAESGSSLGPWSTVATFKSMNKPAGYIRGNEIYDPLIDGKTVGRIVGPAHFIPGVGIMMDSDSSYVEYTLPVTLTSGEYSALVTNLSVVSSTEDPKYRVLTMREGTAAINDNVYRMSVDKRGNGAMAWRFVSGNNSSGAYIETVGAERTVIDMHENLVYFYQATWKNGVFNVLLKEGGVNGTTRYNFGKAYKGTYQPLPHNVYIGSPYASGDRGEPSTCEDMIVRQVWVSPNPRPSYANQ